MKKVCIFLMLISFLKPALGQNERPVTKGHFLTGGSISFYSQTSKRSIYVGQLRQDVLLTNKEDVFQPDITFGYFPINHLAIGLLTNANTYASKTTDDYTPDNVYRYRNSTLGLGPFIRYSTTFGLFVQGSTSFNFNRQSSGDEKWKSQQYSLGIGYSFFIKSVLSLEPSLSYKYTSVPSHGGEKENRKGIFFSLGSYIYFDFKK